ncbi:MAG: AbrB/MazE/SpoVT family DNA-binding domain-containing protein [Kiritimatiellae bacterium]|jgi:AbrB family looped-hinge helix DNA binding protein|nr:AbrB/MazE/SpoVT family DNA-binding domain-containing protein [Kiritimatiellia bacterium]MDD3584721.1 AbrB/MazE/SpoVT family DNA-binding domain-containing protein [Kiritimatiellia bacterium]
MHAVTLSPKFQVVIPLSVRRNMGLRPGQRMKVVEYDGRIELIPERDIKDMRGFQKGIDTSFEREEDRV